MSRNSIAVALGIVFLLVIGGSQLVQPVRTVEADASTVTPTSTAAVAPETLSSTPTPTPSAATLSSDQVYLPAVPFELTVPTSTPCSSQVVQNPSFDNGLVGWATSGIPEVTAKQATDGSTHSVAVGGYNLANDKLGQTIAVPSWATSGTLTAAYFMITGDTPGSNGGFPGIYDTLDFSVLGPNLAVLTQFQTDNTQPEGGKLWTFLSQAIPNVSTFAGSVMTVQFVAQTDPSFPTLWYVDNVQVTFTCGATTASQRFVNPTPEKK